ncbi:DNA repair protein RecN [Corticibacter populi]|uniref:DNA repair protein RecN n=1 Tax=Corticibacter populi TaxID=1550736 RepID=A0A3M6QYK3_9BURK|nr:DNA repair protein RecN [Corticibacter populi]RMX08106.1 DNA repair protein RecN [Corticibacter populi]RZS35356.1 DNA replication and repair protein RecN [Corticibacter populi]
MALRRIVLQNFVVVQQLELELRTGFTVLSGETGAGKSILVDALQLALGARADASWVREGALRADIVAEFDPPAGWHDWLEQHGFDAGESLLLRRSVDAQGKSRAWINGTVATVAQLRELGEALVDIHGQHAWQSLMRPASVRQLLDAYAGADDTAVQQAWQQWRGAVAALAQAQANAEQLQRDRERLQWQIDEVAKLAPQPQEWEALNSRHTRLGNAQDLQSTASRVWELLDGQADEGPALPSLGQAMQLLAGHAHIEPRFDEWIQVLSSAIDQVQDVARSLQAYAEAEDWDAAELQALDARVGQWLTLARRYRQPPEQLPGLWQHWQDELAQIDASTDLQALQQAERQAHERYLRAAETLSALRQVAAPRLSAAITAAMQELGMAGGRFVADLQRLAEPAAHGLDEVQFLVAGHEGSTPRPLGKVASGGELSRISLAIAVTTSGLGDAGTLVFDEVDSGVGGAVAEIVGRLMRQLGEDRQVLAVTHLPQVAACANGHLLVEKKRQGGSVSSSVRPIAGTERAAEIARMLGGETLTPTTLAHAEEMLAAAGSGVGGGRRKRAASATTAPSISTAAIPTTATTQAAAAVPGPEPTRKR